MEDRIKAIEDRNKRVELDKAWETSWTRRGIIIVLTYFVVVLFFYFANLPNPFVNSIVPTLGFVLSTLSLPRWHSCCGLCFKTISRVTCLDKRGSDFQGLFFFFFSCRW